MANNYQPLHPQSPILPEAEVRRLLMEAAGDLGAKAGAVGGAVGGGVVAGAPGATGGGWGGAAGGRSGAKFAAKRNKVMGESRTLMLPITHQGFETLRLSLPVILQATPESGLLVGMVGSGSMNLNPTVVQAVWQGQQLYLTAHALEGLIKQRTARKALDRLVGILSQQ